MCEGGGGLVSLSRALSLGQEDGEDAAAMYNSTVPRIEDSNPEPMKP